MGAEFGWCGPWGCGGAGAQSPASPGRGGDPSHAVAGGRPRFLPGWAREHQELSAWKPAQFIVRKQERGLLLWTCTEEDLAKNCAPFP